MTSEAQLLRIGIILLFIVSFSVLGWLAPVMYASHAPSSSFIEVNNFEAYDTSTSSDSHYLCIDRTVHNPTLSKVVTELYIVDDSGNNIQTQISSQTINNYLKEGHSKIAMEVTLPEGISDGSYKYILTIKMDLADGQIQRTFSYESDIFNVTSQPIYEERKPYC